MKQWKLILVTLLAVLMVCVCTSAMADHTHKPSYQVVAAATCAKEGEAIYNECTVEGCELNEEIKFTLPKTAEHTGDVKGYAAKEATCTEDGYTYYTKCTECDAVLSGKEVKPATGHTEIVKGVRKAATCVEEGVLVYKCTVCNQDTRTEAIEIDPDNHNDKVAYHAAIAATCTTTGMTEYDECSACGKVTWGEKKVVPITHDLVKSLTNSVDPTCTTNGSEWWYCTLCSYSETKVLDSNGAHNMVYNGTVVATCENEGYKKYACSECGEEEKRDVVAALGHKWSTETIYEEAATCTAEGSKWYECVNDGCDAEKEEVVAKIAHTEGKWVRTAPTCEAEGVLVIYCTVCKADLETEAIEALGHDWEYIATQAPTCEVGGYDYWVCKACKTENKPNETEALGHDFSVKSSSTKAPTCENEGYTWYTCAHEGCPKTEKQDFVPATGHKFEKKGATSAATCVADGYTWYHCTNKDCTEIEKQDIVPALGHNWELTDTYAATCTEEGQQVYTCTRCTEWEAKTLEKLPHRYAENQWTWVAEATCTVDGRKMTNCIMCGANPKYEDVAALGHKMGDEIAYGGKAPTCEATGEGYIKCERCTYAEYVVIDALGHEWSKAWTSSAAATCTEDGYKIHPCTREGCTETNKEVIPALKHDTQEEVLVAATCTTQGMKKITCKREGCDYVKYELIAANSHDKVEVVSKTEPTCTEAGVTTKKCGVCGETFVETVAALGHDMVAGAVTAPTCTEGGYTTYECSRCDVTEIKDKTEATGHVDTEEVVTKAATCTEAGKVEVVCDCGEVISSKEVAALGHDLVLIENAVAATPAAPGEDHNACTRCDYYEVVKYNKYTKYYYSNTLTSFGPTTEELLGEGDWYRVTPIDLSVDGIYTFDLIASNAYVVGTVTITVSEGVMTVSYDVNANHIEVKEEALLLYASKADLAEGKAVTVAFGEEINLAETFGEDTKVLVSVMLVGTYDAAGYGVYGFEADAEMLEELLAIVD